MSVTSRCHSANVTIQLRIDGATFAVSQIGPDSMFLDSPISVAPTNAELIVRIDDYESRGPIYLPNGLSLGFHEAHFEEPRS